MTISDRVIFLIVAGKKIKIKIGLFPVVGGKKVGLTQKSEGKKEITKPCMIMTDEKSEEKIKK